MKNYKFIKRTAPFMALAVFGLLFALAFASCNKEVDDDFGVGGVQERVAVPTICPDPELKVPSGTKVHLATTTEGASIYYTLGVDAGEPSAESTPYIDGNAESYPVIAGDDGAVITVKAIAIKGGLSSDVAVFEYTVDNNAAPPIDGNVSVDGTAYIGHTLNAVTSALVYDETGTLSYQWEVAGTVKGTGASYTVEAADFHKAITLSVSASKNSGSITDTATESARGVPLAELPVYLGALDAGGAASPNVVPLDTCSISGENWITINSDIEAAEKYVALDLTDCTATGNTIWSSSEDSSESDFNIIKDNVYIKGVILPSSLTCIGANAFRDCKKITSVIIPDSVTSIENHAFAGSGITSIAVPDSVTGMEWDVFNGCSSLASAQLGNGISSINARLFEDCIKLEAIVIPNGVSDIHDSAFVKCRELASVTLPDSLINIENNAFDFCSILSSVTIPAGVTTLEDEVFDRCSALTTVVFAEGSSITSFGSDVFPEGNDGYGGDALKTAYNGASPHAGTYSRSPLGSDWAKQ